MSDMTMDVLEVSKFALCIILTCPPIGCDTYTRPYADLFGIAAELLPLVLTHLLVESTAIRLLASGVLAKLAALLVKEPKAVSNQDRRTPSMHVFNFLHGQAFFPRAQMGKARSSKSCRSHCKSICRRVLGMIRYGWSRFSHL